MRPTSREHDEQAAQVVPVPERADGAEEGVGEQGGRRDDQEPVSVPQLGAGEEQRDDRGAPADDEDRLGERREGVDLQRLLARRASRLGVVVGFEALLSRRPMERRTASPARDRRGRSGGRPPRPEPPRPVGQGRRQHELRWLRHLRASPADRHATPPWGLRTLPGQRTRRDTRCRGGDGACRTSGGLRRATVPPWSLIGLTGGIGSGKSTVSALLAERGALVIDADAITRELQQPGTAGVRGDAGPVRRGDHRRRRIARPAGGRRHRVRRRGGAQGPRRDRAPGRRHGDRRPARGRAGNARGRHPRRAAARGVGS